MSYLFIYPFQHHPLINYWKRYFTLLRIYKGRINNVYDLKFYQSLLRYQLFNKINTDGIINNTTWCKALSDGLIVPEVISNTFPLKPSIENFKTNLALFKEFGLIEFTHAPLSHNPENISITNNFEKDNIIRVQLPQIEKISYGNIKSIRMHYKALKPMKGLIDELEKQNLIHQIKTFNGCYVPRLMRGSDKLLSHHAFGVAFDLNVRWNMFSKEPTKWGKYGSVREIVSIANEYGWYWGGHFKSKDGMHFELCTEYYKYSKFQLNV